MGWLSLNTTQVSVVPRKPNSIAFRASDRRVEICVLLSRSSLIDCQNSEIAKQNARAASCPGLLDTARLNHYSTRQ